jgi:hypothetical protein
MDFMFEMLNSSDPAAIAEYESAFYQSFSGLTTNRLVQKLWLWDHTACRLKTRIPYTDQLICCMRDHSGRLHSAMAFNVELRQFQSASYGFTAPQAASGSFEVLTFFAVAAQTLDVCAKFWSNCLDLLGRRGLTIGYATTARRPLPMYRRVGWQVVQEQEIESEMRYFLHYNSLEV